MVNNEWVIAGVGQMWWVQEIWETLVENRKGLYLFVKSKLCPKTMNSVTYLWQKSCNRYLTHPFPMSRLVAQIHLRKGWRSEEHTSELQSHVNLVCRLLLEKK